MNTEIKSFRGQPSQNLMDKEKASKKQVGNRWEVTTCDVCQSSTRQFLVFPHGVSSDSDLVKWK